MNGSVALLINCQRTLKERLGALGLALYDWHIDMADDDNPFSFHIARREPDYEES